MDNYILQQKKLVKGLENSFFRNKVKSTTVKIQNNYERDDGTCLTLLSFIPKNISKKIEKYIIKPLKNIDPDHFYFPAGSMHLTIKNIRTVHKPPLFANDDILKVNQLFKKIIPQFPRFNYYLEDLVLFPTSLFLMGYCCNIIKELVDKLDSGLKKIGLPDNKKYLSSKILFGNITLCRFTHKPSISFIKKVKELKNIKIGELIITEAKLVTCNVVCRPKTRNIIALYKFKKS